MSLGGPAPRGGVAVAATDTDGERAGDDARLAEAEEHPQSFEPGVGTGYLRRGVRDHDLPVEIGAAPFDPGEERYDSRRARRAARRAEKADRKRRKRAERQRRAAEERGRKQRLRAEEARRERAERLERERAQRERRDRQARPRAELERLVAEQRRRPEPASTPSPSPRLRPVPEHRRDPHPRVVKPRPRDLRRPTVKAAAALAAVTAIALGAGSLLGLPLPGTGSGSGSSAASLAAAPGLAVDAGTPAGLTEGPYFPVALDRPANFGEAAAKFHADRGGRKHEGQDVFAKIGTPLVAVREGIVLDGAGGRNFYAPGGGNTLVIYSPLDDRSYVYLHMSRPPAVRTGDQVHAGQRVGEVGCTGSCFGAHLHFEVRNGRADWGADAKAVDPLPLLRQWPQVPTR